MLKLDLNKTEWLELVFENKNKTYGAYQLRQENGKTTAKAFFGGLGLVAGLAALPVILSSFSKKDFPNTDGGGIISKLDTTLIVTEVKFPEKEKVVEKQIEKAEKIAPKTQELNNNVRIVKSDEAKKTDFKENKDLGIKTSENPLALNGSVTGDPKGNTIEKVPERKEPIDNGSLIVTDAIAEKSPMFPGGIDAFLRIVGSRFQAPEAEEGEGTKRIIVMFVVERDGSLSNITVPRSAGKELDDEAIRVLKSIKTKWEPGIYNKQPVRTQYSLPIVVQTN